MLESDRIRFLVRTIKTLERRIHNLEETVQSLAMRHPVEQMLVQRGHQVLSFNDFSEVILPQTGDNRVHSKYYQLLKRYSFRLFMKDLINKVEGSDWRDISRYCSESTARNYVNFLKSAGLIEVSHRNCNYSYIGPKVRSFGATLEWYIHELLKSEFFAPTLFSVKLKNTAHGGDYDVISAFHGFLVYIEVKSSPPRGVELTNVEAFLNRLEDINPDIALFLVDTELRMKDKIVKLFEEATNRDVKRLIRELFFMDGGIYLVNTQKGIVSNMRRCFEHFFKARKK